MKIVFLETKTLGDDVDLSMFDSLGEVVKYPLASQEDKDRIMDADIAVVNKRTMDEDLLCHAKQLRMIALTATGTNAIDFAYTKTHEITVANVKGYSTASVVQHTFALFFYVYEKLHFYDHFVKSGGYVKSDIYSVFTERFHELSGKTWGIIGLGEIGRGVAAIAKLFGCRVIYYSTSGKNSNQDYERVSFEMLLRESDVISIHAPLNAETQDLIGEAELNRMKPDAVLLNLGRGPIINQEALTMALLENRIGAVGLDVLTVEPMAADNPLLQIKDSRKLIITPHIAWTAVEARKRCVKEVYLNIEAFLRGEKRSVVTS